MRIAHKVAPFFFEEISEESATRQQQIRADSWVEGCRKACFGRRVTEESFYTLREQMMIRLFL